MTAGPLATLLDYCGNRVIDGITDVKAVYSAHASDDPDRVLWIPDGLDASLTCLVWPNGGTLKAGNTETYLYDIDLHFWINKARMGEALKVAVQAVDSCRVLFRRDITAGANADWVLVQGHSAPGDEFVNSVPYLIQTVQLRALSMHFSSDYTVAA